MNRSVLDVGRVASSLMIGIKIYSYNKNTDCKSRIDLEVGNEIPKGKY